VQSGANVLILDEPTNHLDIESREALEDALSDFPGTLLLVSHDRALLDAVGSRTIAVEEGTLHSYAGGWSDYLERRRARDEAPKAKAKAEAKPKVKPAAAAPSKNSARKQARLEKQIEQAEAELKALEEELADPSAWASPTGAQRATRRHNEAKQKVAALMDEWETVATG
jgi:ATP-binding cassette subfamily F protein 3